MRQMYEREQAKSISNSTVLPYNYRDSGMIKNVISDLSKEIGKKLRDNKLYADTIGIWFKYTYFDKISKQVKLDNSIANDCLLYTSVVLREVMCYALILWLRITIVDMKVVM